tara:strand:+ start:12 stop:662 length:651 start_codon:yes stop_codon:yes gene_type:complete
MKGDSIVVEDHHRLVAEELSSLLIERVLAGHGKYVITVAGESGSGKSETATAIAEMFSGRDITAIIFQQDDYFIYPPKSNDARRRNDISKVGPHEVDVKILDSHLRAFRDGIKNIEKPLIDYEGDTIDSEEVHLGGIQVAIAEGTYTSMLENVDMRIFIARDYNQTRQHREKRRRDAAELDMFIDEVLKIEHRIISSHRTRADVVINADYSVSYAG